MGQKRGWGGIIKSQQRGERTRMGQRAKLEQERELQQQKEPKKE